MKQLSFFIANQGHFGSTQNSVSKTHRGGIFALVYLLFALMPYTGQAQISEGGQPFSFTAKMEESFPIQNMPAVDVQNALQEDILRERVGGSPWRFGINIPVNLDLLKLGETQILAGGDRLVRFGIRATGAMTINLIFSKFRLPQGAKLFIYNKDKTDILGAFTKFNNQEDRKFGTTLIRGDEIILEYFEPVDAEFKSELTLGTVTHGYKDVFKYAKAFGSSGSCNVNVNCSQAVGWECEKRSVVMLVTGGNGFCTGALINNTSQNRTPYVLTANHCGGGESTWVFWFNWESATCTNPASSPAFQSMSGSVLRANNAGTDVELVQINGTIPANFNAAFAGWSRAGTTVAAAYGIHHPAGDIKKFSAAPNSTISSSYSGADCWRVGQWTIGVTEPGSSGSPLFDPNHRIIGQLFGGPSSCSASDANKNDFYGKFHVSWSTGSTAATRLRDWLDPTNLNPTTLDGLDCVPTCPAPSTPSVSSIAATTATVSWPAVSGATFYRVEYKTAAAASWTALANTTVSTSALSGLVAATAYNVRVFTICGALTSVASPTANFTTLSNCSAPSQPTFTNLSAIGTTVNWTSVIGASSYQVEYKTAAASSWTALPITGRTYQTLNGLVPSTDYNVRVYATCSLGTSPPSVIGNFRTLDPPCLPTPTPTATDIAAYSATINWSSVLGATAYRVEYKTVVAATWTVLANTSSFNAGMTGLTPSTPYSVRVFTICGGTTSDASPILNFATLAPPTCPDANTPAISNLTSDGATVSWVVPAGVQSHRVEYKRTVDAGWSVWSTAVAGTSTVLTGLAGNTFYDVRTLTNCIGIVGINYSEIVSFRTLASICNPAPTPSVSSITASGAVVSWSAVSGATAYKLEYKTAIAASWTALANTSSTSVSLSGLSALTVYNVRLSVICAAGTGSPSGVVNFTTLAAPSCAAPSTPSVSAISSNGATVSWAAVSGATVYRVEYKTSAAGSWTALSNTSNTEVNLTGLLAATVYDVRVFTLCGSLTSAASPTATFTTLPSGFVCNATTAPTVSGITASGATINWAVALGAVAYRVEYKVASASSWIQMPNTGRTNQALSGLASSTQYNVRVFTVCDGATSSPSPTINFTTLAAPCTATSSPLVSNAMESSVTVSWAAVGGALAYRVEYKLFAGTSWTALPNVSSTTIQITGLTPSTAYNVRVFTICAASTSESSPVSSFATTASTFCPNPNTPFITNITISRATVNWVNPIQTESHRVEYKRAADATWIVWAAEEYGTSSLLVSLASGTTYQVRTFLTCGATSGANYSTVVSFTTLGTSSGCTDSNESNNTFGQARFINVNSMTAGSITTVGDLDYYTFTTTAAAPNISLYLNQLSVDFDLELYNSSQTLIGSSVGDASSSEFIEYSTTTAGTYYILVLGYEGAVNVNCYQLTLLTDGSTPFCSTFSIAGDKDAASVANKSRNLGNSLSREALKLVLYPNPAQTQVTLTVSASQTGEYDLRFFDFLGKAVISKKVSLSEGENRITVPTNMLSKGIYMVRMFRGQESVVQKLSIH